ncbi:MAG TPA: DUF1501 domain-containing protein [Polyangiaceae bacterium]|jgi:hypothetical protein
MLVKRRDALFTALFGAGALGLRAIATGLPAWFIANPRKATAADLSCAINPPGNLQYLIASVSANGDPINCNCPGTYEAPSAVHPTDATMVSTPVTLGGKSYGAAAPWAGLAPAVLGRTSFFHHVTRSIVHGDQPKVLRLMGDTSNGEMIVSAYAKHLGPCLGTVQNEPVAVGAGTNASELLSYSGRGLPSVSPTQLRQLLTGAGASGGFKGSTGSPLVALRATRDMYLDQLYDMAKSDGTGIQKAFIDALALSQTQVRALADTLHDTLSKINGDDVTGQSLAAAALISAKVTPVVTMHIPFGGDNHTDSNLANEVSQTVSGVAAITTLMGDLSSMSLTDTVTFATLNVFGRNLDGIAKVTSMQGRDHYGNHNVCVMIGKNVAPSVIGGVTLANGALVASDIDSGTGSATAGADVPKDQTHAALARTLGVALGIPSAQVDQDLVATAGGKVIPAALTAVV